MDIFLMYLRKSRADNPDETVEEVLAKHERMLQDLAIKIIGKRIEEKYIYREVVSGETIEDRPKIKKVLSDISNPNVKGIFVVEPQRLSRGDWEDGGKILTGFKYSNTLIYTITKTFDLHNEYDYKMFKMDLSQGNDYLEYYKMIQRRGKERSSRDGNYIGSIAPYGFQKAIIDDCPSLEEYTPESKVINYAAHLRVNDRLGWTKIARELDRLGIKPRNGENWSPYGLRDICLNPVNIGKIKWYSRKEVKVYEEGKLRTTRPRNKEDVILVDGKHTPIMNIDIYNKLLEMEGSISKEKPSTELVNPFAGLIFCGNCGRAMTYRTYKNKDGSIRSEPRLLCNNQVHCKTKSSTFHDIYDSVISTLEAIVENFKMQIKDDDESSNMYDVHSKMVENANKQLEDIENRQDKLYDLLENQTYTKEVFLKRNSKLDEERQKVLKQIEYLKENMIEPINYEEKIKTFKNVITTLNDPFISAKEKNILLKNVIQRIDYYRDSSNRTKWDSSKAEIKIKLKDF